MYAKPYLFFNVPGLTFLVLFSAGFGGGGGREATPNWGVWNIIQNYT